MMNEEYCSQCNPKGFVVFGYCINCGKRCHRPLMDLKKLSLTYTQQEWEEYPEYLSHEQLQGIKNGTINFITKTGESNFINPDNPL